MKSNEEELKSINGLIPFLKKNSQYNDIRKWEYIYDPKGNKVEVALLFEKPTGFGDIIFYIPIKITSILLRDQKVHIDDRRDKSKSKKYILNLSRLNTLIIRNHILEKVKYLEEYNNKKLVDEFVNRRGNGGS